MKKIEVLSILLSFCILTIGALFGYFYEPIDFARSGSILVVVAVLFTVFGVKPRLDKLLITAIVKQNTAGLKYDFDMNDAEDRDLSENLDKHIKRLKNEVEKRSFRALKLEAVILSLGTIVWGFGDLVYKII
jgi:hypothetical protein